MTRVVFVIGAGGVGKTTVAAALALAVARPERRTLVLTVDPAQRLAQAMGVEHLHNTPIGVAGGLDAAMLDPAASWENLVQRHTDPATADRLVTSRFFRAIADRFPAGQAYAAAEETARLVEDGTYDLVVVDTPPFGGGVDFFDAPRQIRTLVAGRALRLLTGPPIPGRQAVFSMTARPALRLADRVLGGPLLEDLGAFLIDLRTTYDGIRARAAEVDRIVESSAAIIVTTPDPGPVSQARLLLEQRASGRRSVVLNRVVPAAWIGGGEPAGDAYDRNLALWSQEAMRHEAVAESLVVLGAEVVDIPWMSEAPTSLDSLADLGRGAGIDRLLR